MMRVLTLVLEVVRFLYFRISNILGNIYMRSYLYAYHIDCSKGIEFNGFTFMRFRNDSVIHFGKKVIINSGEYYSMNYGHSKIVVDSNASLYIGDYSGISNTLIYCKKNITIGDFVNIGQGCMIFDTNFHSMDWKIRKDRNKDCFNSISKPIQIDNYVFIGAHCIITKGVHIGERSIVAAGSVVICDIPKDEIWGGNPAVFIKKVQ